MSNRPASCKAYVEGQQWFCDQCGVTWDLDEDIVCKPVTVITAVKSFNKDKARRAVNDMRNIFNNKD